MRPAPGPPYYAAKATLVPVSAGVGFQPIRGDASPFVEVAPSIVWSHWSYKNEYLNIRSFARVLAGIQLSVGVRLKASDQVGIRIGAMRYWSEEMTSEELDALGRWNYRAFDGTAILARIEVKR